MKYREKAVVTEQREIAQDIYSLWLHAEEIAKEARPGQFVSVYCQDESRILPRPISICEIDKESGRIRLVYRVAGEGTKEFSGYDSGDTLEICRSAGKWFSVRSRI